MRTLLVDTRPLQQSPAFRRLWVGSAVSAIGSAMTGFAVTLQVWQLTRSSAAVGALALVSGVAILGVGLFGGALADAMDRRRLVLVTTSCLAAGSVGFAVQAFLRVRSVPLLFVLAALQGLFVAVDAPARRTFLPRLLPADQLSAGVALQQLSFHASGTCGPALAGLLAAAGGVRLCYLVDAASFLAALYGLAGLPAMPAQSGAARPGVRSVVDGLRYVRRSPVLAGAFLADLDATVLGMPLAVFPELNARVFGGSPGTLGLLVAAPAVGGLLGSALSGPVGRVSRHGRAMLVAVVVWGGCIAAFGLSRVLWLSLGLLAVAGAADTVSVIFRGTIVQTVTPELYRGRVTSVDFVVGAGAPQLGNVRAGVVAALTSPGVSAVSGGLAAVLGAALLARAVPALRRYDARL